MPFTLASSRVMEGSRYLAQVLRLVVDTELDVEVIDLFGGTDDGFEIVALAPMLDALPQG
jgi:hypothetical protein